MVVATPSGRSCAFDPPGPRWWSSTRSRLRPAERRSPWCLVHEHHRRGPAANTDAGSGVDGYPRRRHHLPRGLLPHGLINVFAASRRPPIRHYALQMAPGWRRSAPTSTAPSMRPGGIAAVTYVGHSYGGSILGTAEASACTGRADALRRCRSGVGVDDPGDQHNRNPDVLAKSSATRPATSSSSSKACPAGRTVPTPTRCRGAIRFGHRILRRRHADGRTAARHRRHRLRLDSDSWRTILAVITGDRQHIQVADDPAR